MRRAFADLPRGLDLLRYLGLERADEGANMAQLGVVPSADSGVLVKLGGGCGRCRLQVVLAVKPVLRFALLNGE